MGNASSTPSGHSSLVVPGSPGDLRYRKRLSFPGLFRNPKSASSFDMEVGNIVNSRRIDDFSPTNPSSNVVSPDDGMGLVPVPFSQGKRKPQPVKASNPTQASDLESGNGGFGGDGDDGGDAEQDNDYEINVLASVMSESENEQAARAVYGQVSISVAQRHADEHVSEVYSFQEIGDGERSQQPSSIPFSTSLALDRLEAGKPMPEAAQLAATAASMVPMRPPLMHPSAATDDGSMYVSEISITIPPGFDGADAAAAAAAGMRKSATRTTVVEAPSAMHHRSESGDAPASQGIVPSASAPQGMAAAASASRPPAATDAKRPANPVVMALRNKSEPNRSASSSSLGGSGSRLSHRKQFHHHNNSKDAGDSDRSSIRSSNSKHSINSLREVFVRNPADPRDPAASVGPSAAATDSTRSDSASSFDRNSSLASGLSDPMPTSTSVHDRPLFGTTASAVNDTSSNPKIAAAQRDVAEKGKQRQQVQAQSQQKQAQDQQQQQQQQQQQRHDSQQNVGSNELSTHASEGSMDWRTTQASVGSNSSLRLRQAMKPMPSEQHGMRRGTIKRAAAIAKFRMIKFNSTSTLFVESTMINADLQESLRYISLYLANSIRRNIAEGSLRSADILSERTHLLSKHIQFYHRAPSDEEVFRFLECLFQSAELNVECVIITLIYIQRMLANTGISIQPNNWARVVLGGVILASKVWDDHAVWNVDFCQIFPDVDVSDLNELERFYMAGIEYDVSVRASVYASYYFELRDMAETASRPWALKPLKRSETNKIMPKPVNISNTRLPPEEPEKPVEDDILSESQAEYNLKHKRPERHMRRSHSDYRFIPSEVPAFVILEKIVEIIDEAGIASAKVGSSTSDLNDSITLKLKHNPDQRVYIMRDERRGPPRAQDARNRRGGRLAESHASLADNDSDFHFNTGGLAGFGDLANPDKYVVVGLLKVGIKKLFLVDEYGRQIEISPLCVLDFYIHEAYQRQGFGKRMFEFMLAIEFRSASELCYDRPSDKFLAFLKKHYGLHEYVPQPNNFIVFREFGLGLLELDAKGRPKPPLKFDPLALPASKSRPTNERPAQRGQRSEGLLAKFSHITKSGDPSPHQDGASGPEGGQHSSSDSQAAGGQGGGPNSSAANLDGLGPNRHLTTSQNAVGNGLAGEALTEDDEEDDGDFGENERSFNEIPGVDLYPVGTFRGPPGSDDAEDGEYKSHRRNHHNHHHHHKHRQHNRRGSNADGGGKQRGHSRESSQSGLQGHDGSGIALDSSFPPNHLRGGDLTSMLARRPNSRLSRMSMVSTLASSTLAQGSGKPPSRNGGTSSSVRVASVPTGGGDDPFASPLKPSTPNPLAKRAPGDPVPIDPHEGPIDWSASRAPHAALPATYARGMPNPELAAQEAERKARIRMLMQADRFPHLPQHGGGGGVVGAAGGAAGIGGMAAGGSLNVGLTFGPPKAPGPGAGLGHLGLGFGAGASSSLSSVALISSGLGSLVERGPHGRGRGRDGHLLTLRPNVTEQESRFGLSPLGLQLDGGVGKPVRH
nr:hypothetical protein HK105_006588 [Polyrhizophydium stewartii]